MWGRYGNVCLIKLSDSHWKCADKFFICNWAFLTQVRFDKRCVRSVLNCVLKFKFLLAHLKSGWYCFYCWYWGIVITKYISRWIILQDFFYYLLIYYINEHFLMMKFSLENYQCPSLKMFHVQFHYYYFFRFNELGPV